MVLFVTVSFFEVLSRLHYFTWRCAILLNLIFLLRMNLHNFVCLFSDSPSLLQSREVLVDCLTGVSVSHVLLGTPTAKEERKRSKEKRDRSKGKKRRLEIETKHLHGQPIEQVNFFWFTFILSVSCRLIK